MSLMYTVGDELGVKDSTASLILLSGANINMSGNAIY